MLEQLPKIWGKITSPFRRGTETHRPGSVEMGRTCSLASHSSNHLTRPILFAFEAAQEHARQVIEDLHAFAPKCDLTEISNVYDIESECLPLTDQDTDPIKSLKIDAIMKIKVLGRAILVSPIKIIAFSSKMPNGRHMRLGLAFYPEKVVLPSDRSVLDVSTLGSTSWESLAYTSAGDNVDLNIRSHRACISMLKHANDLGALEKVIDDTGFWDQQDENLLRSPASGE